MDIYSEEFIGVLLINIVITSLAYCGIPILLRLIKGKYEYEQGKKIILLNCIIICFLFIIIKASQGNIASSGAVILYFYINKAILLKPKNDIKDNKETTKKNKANELIKENTDTKVNNISNESVKNDKTEDIIDVMVNNSTKTKKKMSHSKEKKHNYLFYIIISILVICLIVVVGYSIDENSTNSKLEKQISKLEKEKKSLRDEKNVENAINKLNEDKLDFFENNVVFVLEGYGKYYYTYEQMQQVTQSSQFSYWAYNKEQAIGLGYRAWK